MIAENCTCRKQFGYVFGEYRADCPRHASTVFWFATVKKRYLSRMAALRQQALTRPVHGGYPAASPLPQKEVSQDFVPTRPGGEGEDECGTCRKALPEGCSTEFQGDASCALTHGVAEGRKP